MTDPFAILTLIVCVPFLGMLFVLTSKEDDLSRTHNGSNVAIFTIIANLVLIWRVFMLIDENKPHLQLFEKFNWLPVPDINLVFAVDNLSLLMILAVHLVILTGIIFSRSETARQKSTMVFTLLFLSMSTGLFVAADIFSFFIFFEAVLLPLFMLIGLSGGLKKTERTDGFLLYNLIGALVLFVGILLIYQAYGSLTLDKAPKILWKKHHGYWIFGLLALGFISRIPVWPFHYWIASISSKIKNPLVFIASAVLPLSGIYGLIRFWPRYIPLEVSQYFVWVNVIGTVTMLFIGLIGLSNKESQYKIFAYVTVGYIMYLLGIFSQNKQIVSNIGYALFGFLIIAGALESLSAYIRSKSDSQDTTDEGFLCRAKRLSLVYSFITVAAIGFPVSAVFTNNFLILSTLLAGNIQMGMVLIVSFLIVAGSLIEEMFRLKTESKDCALGKSDDLPAGEFVFMLFIMFVLLMSFIRPLWFVVGR